MAFFRHGVACALAVAAAACHLDLADAATIKGNEAACQSLAAAFDNITLYRMMGMTWETAKPQLEAAIKESREAADGIVRDDEDAAYVMSIGSSLWNGALAALGPGEVGQAVYTDCMAARKMKWT